MQAQVVGSTVWPPVQVSPGVQPQTQVSGLRTRLTGQAMSVGQLQTQVWVLSTFGGEHGGTQPSAHGISGPSQTHVQVSGLRVWATGHSRSSGQRHTQVVGSRTWSGRQGLPTAQTH